jgi:SARP family transcriptional regulator, regulator of embCAB operon
MGTANGVAQMATATRTDISPPVERPPARLRLVGRFELSRPGRVVRLTAGTERLLAFLALNRDVVRRESIAGALWGDSDDQRANGNLRSALWRLRSTGLAVVHVTGPNVLLSPDLQIDLDQAILLANSVINAVPPVDISCLDISLLTHDILTGWYEDWFFFERERFRQLRVHALESLCEQQLSAGLVSQAVQSSLAAVSADPLRESAHRALIRAHLAEGNYSEARRQYRILADVLMKDLGIHPSAEARKLIDVIER